MKKLFCLGAVGVVFVFMSCKDSSTSAPDGKSDTTMSQAERNKTNNRLIMKAIETGDAAVIDSLIASDAVDHSSPDMREIRSGDSIKSMLKNMHNSVTDMKNDIIADAADGDYVFSLSRMTGTTTANPGMGMPPNTKMDMTGVDVVKFRDGKAVEHWSYMDPKEMMKMMPPPATGKMNDKMKETMKDTMKKK